jgi:hypothetical protein
LSGLSPQDSLAKGLEQKFRSISALATGFIRSSFEDGRDEYNAGVGIVSSYQSATAAFRKPTGESGLLQSVSIPAADSFSSFFPDMHGHVRTVLANSEAAAPYLAKERVPAEIRDRLDALRKEIAGTEVQSPDLFTHVSAAISEHESAHYLASVALSAKAIDYVVSKLNGTDDVSKADYLVQEGLLNKEVKNAWIATWRKVRNYYTRDLSSDPSPKESLSLLTNACELAVSFAKLNGAT